jgi:hypothetical protein
MELSDILGRSIPLSVDWMGEAFEFGYNPKGYDETLHVTLTRVQNLPDESPEKITVTVDIVQAMVVTWSLTEKGTPLPITAEWVRKLPALLRGAMVEKIMENVSAKRVETDDPKSDQPSSAGSSPADSGATHLNGTDSYALQNGSGSAPGTYAVGPTPLVVTGGGTGQS